MLAQSGRRAGVDYPAVLSVFVPYPAPCGGVFPLFLSQETLRYSNGVFHTKIGFHVNIVKGVPGSRKTTPVRPQFFMNQAIFAFCLASSLSKP